MGNGRRLLLAGRCDGRWCPGGRRLLVAAQPDAQLLRSRRAAATIQMTRQAGARLAGVSDSSDPRFARASGRARMPICVWSCSRHPPREASSAVELCWAAAFRDERSGPSDGALSDSLALRVGPREVRRDRRHYIWRPHLFIALSSSYVGTFSPPRGAADGISP